MDRVEGTGSNELTHYGDRLEIQYYIGSYKKPPSFAPHDFFKNQKNGSPIEEDHFVEQEVNNAGKILP